MVFDRHAYLQGNVLGTVVGQAIANVSTPNFNDDGGYGSIPSVLLRVAFPFLPLKRIHICPRALLHFYSAPPITVRAQPQSVPFQPDISEVRRPVQAVSADGFFAGINFIQVGSRHIQLLSCHSCSLSLQTLAA